MTQCVLKHCSDALELISGYVNNTIVINLDIARFECVNNLETLFRMHQNPPDIWVCKSLKNSPEDIMICPCICQVHPHLLCLTAASGPDLLLSACIYNKEWCHVCVSPCVHLHILSMHIIMWHHPFLPCNMPTSVLSTHWLF